MRNSSDGSDNRRKIFFNFDVVSLIEGPFSPKQSEYSDRSFDSTLQIRLTSFGFSHNSNPRIGTDFVSTARKDTLNSSFLCSRVSVHTDHGNFGVVVSREF